MVDDEKRLALDWSHNEVVVAEDVVPKVLAWRNESPPPPPVPQAAAATPTMPLASICRHRVEPTPMPEMVSFVVDAVPVLSIAKSVESMPLNVVEPIAKSVEANELVAVWIESVAHGVDVPIPTRVVEASTPPLPSA